MRKLTKEISIPGLHYRCTRILLHMLGFDNCGNGKMYRNNFSAAGEDIGWCYRLAEKGLLDIQPNISIIPNGKLFKANKMGIAVALRAISDARCLMNCFQCNWLDYDDDFEKWVCMKVEDVGDGGKLLGVDQLFKSKRCYEGIWKIHKEAFNV